MLPMFAMMTLMPGLGRATERTFQFDTIGDSTWDKGIQGLVDAQCVTEEGEMRLKAFCYSLLWELKARGLLDESNRNDGEETKRA